MIRAVDWLLGFSLVFYAPAAGLLLVLRAVYSKSWKNARRIWWVLWLSVAALAIVQAGAGRLPEAADLAAFTVLGFFAGLIVGQPTVQRILFGALTALPFLLVFVVIDAYSPYATWQVTRGNGSVSSVPFKWLPLKQFVNAEQSSVELIRPVSLRANDQGTLAARGSMPMAFYVNYPETKVVQSGLNSRIAFPASDFASAYKPFRIQSPEYPVRMRVDLRMVSAAVPVQGCRGLSLRTFDASGEAQTNCQPSEVSTSWHKFSQTWSPPGGWEQEYVWVGLFDFGGHSLEVRDLHVEQYVDEQWTPLAAVENLLIRLDYAGDEVTASWHEVTKEWSPLLSSSPAMLTGSVRVSVPLGAQLTLANSVDWKHIGVLPAKRASAWYVHPNLLAHTALALLVLILVSSPSRRMTVVGSSLLLVLILLTGSRIANVLGFLSVGGLLMMRVRQIYTKVLIAIIGVSWFAVLGYMIPRLSPATLLTGVSENVASRFEIWKVAWIAMAANPMLGVGKYFARFFAEIWDGPEYGVAHHAHNIWLHFGATYGVPGVLSITALIVGLSLLVAASRNYVALAGLMVILILNLVDSTLIIPGVLIPASMIVGLACQDHVSIDKARRRLNIR